MSRGEPSGAGDAELDARVVGLEERYSHMQRLLAELDEVVAAQQRAIDTLTLRVVRLEERQRELLTAVDGAPPHEKPPHY